MSIRALAFDALVKRLIARSGVSDVSAEIARRRNEGQPEPAEVPAAIRKRFHVSEMRVAGSRVITLRRGNVPSERAAVFIAGGAYAHPIQMPHWRSYAQYAAAAEIDVVVPLYEVVPLGDAVRANEFVADVLENTIAQRGAGNVYLGGDSAGGGLALSVLQQHPDGVRAALLLSPWVDVELEHPAADVFDSWDVILEPGELREWGQAWAGELPTSDPAVSPIHGRLDGLPPVHVFTGGRDLLMPQALDVYRLLQQAGNAGSLVYAPDANHAVGVSGSVTPESRRVYDAVVRILRS